MKDRLFECHTPRMAYKYRKYRYNLFIYLFQTQSFLLPIYWSSLPYHYLWLLFLGSRLSIKCTESNKDTVTYLTIMILVTRGTYFKHLMDLKSANWILLFNLRRKAIIILLSPWIYAEKPIQPWSLFCFWKTGFQQNLDEVQKESWDKF